MPDSRTLASIAACLAFLAAARFTGDPGPGGPPILGPSDIAALVQAAEKSTLTAAAAESVRKRLRADDMSEPQVSRALEAIETRRRKALARYARTLEGRAIDLESARAAVRARAAILEHNVESRPRSYASGLPITFLVDESDTVRFGISLDALVRDREGPLREVVRGLAFSGAVGTQDAGALGELTRALVWRRARSTLESMRGASFFSAEDAGRFLDRAITREVEALRTSLADPRARAALLGRARTRTEAKPE